MSSVALLKKASLPQTILENCKNESSGDVEDGVPSADSIRHSEQPVWTSMILSAVVCTADSAFSSSFESLVLGSSKYTLDTSRLPVHTRNRHGSVQKIHCQHL